MQSRIVPTTRASRKSKSHSVRNNRSSRIQSFHRSLRSPCQAQLQQRWLLLNLNRSPRSMPGLHSARSRVSSTPSNRPHRRASLYWWLPLLGPAHLLHHVCADGNADAHTVPYAAKGGMRALFWFSTGSSRECNMQIVSVGLDRGSATIPNHEKKIRSRSCSVRPENGGQHRKVLVKATYLVVKWSHATAISGRLKITLTLAVHVGDSLVLSCSTEVRI